MGKSRNSPNLYEILRTAAGPVSRPSATPTDGSAPNLATMTPPPVPSPATTTKMEPAPEPPKVAAPRQAKDVTTLKPADTESRLETVEVTHHKMVTGPPSFPAPKYTSMLNPSPSPSATPRPVQVDTGDKSIRLSYNALMFAGLGMILVVIATYVIGARVGRGQAVAAPGSGLSVAVPEAEKKWTVQLIEYSARGSEQRTTANALAIKLKEGLDKAGFKNAEIATLGTAPDQRVALLYGRFADRDSREAKDALAALKALKIGKETKPNFAATAVFVAAQ